MIAVLGVRERELERERGMRFQSSIPLQCERFMKVKVPWWKAHRRYSYRKVVVAGILLAVLFIRAALLVLDDAASTCPPISCLKWGFGPRFLGAKDASLEIGREELRKAWLADEAEGGGSIDPTVVEAAPESLNGLMAELLSSSLSNLDIRTFVRKTNTMLMKMEHKVQSARLRASSFRYLASIGIPKSMHCLTMKLAEEYLTNSLARASLPPPELASRLVDSSYLHLALLTDNVLAASVAVASTLASSAKPESIVFHIVTDKKTYAAMHAWFALHPSPPTTIEVKGLHQFDWPALVSRRIMETINEIHRCSAHHRHGFIGSIDDFQRIEALKPSSFSLLNYLKIHLPELFPKLERVIYLDDDVVVRRDLSSLWEQGLNGKVNGAVISTGGNEGGGCIGGKLSDYLNFSDRLISSSGLGLEGDRCMWVGGMNVFDLDAWRRTNITQTHQHWLKMNRESGFRLWRLGPQPPALLAFNGHVQSIDPSWHLSGLGRRVPDPDLLESAAVLHFSGPGKPWLEFGFSGLQEVWRSHVNQSDQFIRSCRVVE